MAKDSIVMAESRTETGTSESRRLRRSGRVPGIVCGTDGKAELVHLSHHDFEQLLHHHAGENLVLDLQVGKGSPTKVLLTEVQHDSVSGNILHLDFKEISMTEKMIVDVPLTLVGDAEGVTQGGGILEQLVRELEVECLPADLPEEIIVDVTALKIGDTILAGDIETGEKLVILTPDDIAVAHVSAPKTEDEPVVAEGEEGAAGEPEVIGEKDKDAAEDDSGKADKKE